VSKEIVANRRDPEHGVSSNGRSERLFLEGLGDDGTRFVVVAHAGSATKW
jgi:hypothetical protein